MLTGVDMQGFHCRQLTETDCNVVNALIESQKNKFKSGGNTFEDYKSSVVGYLSPMETSTRLFGVFNNEDLISMMGCYLWPTLPIGSLVFLFSRQNQALNINSAGLSGIYSLCIEFFEQNRVYDWYIWAPLRKTQSHMRIWNHHSIAELSRYYSYQAATVPAGTCSIYKTYWRVMDSKVWPFESEVRVTSLLPQYRKNVHLKSRSSYFEG